MLIVCIVTFYVDENRYLLLLLLFFSMKGNPPTAYVLRAALKVACEVICIEFSPQVWRPLIESILNKRFMKESTAKQQMEATSAHMDHSEATTAKHYRLTTSGCAEATGQALKTILKQGSGHSLILSFRHQNEQAQRPMSNLNIKPRGISHPTHMRILAFGVATILNHASLRKCRPLKAI